MTISGCGCDALHPVVTGWRTWIVCFFGLRDRDGSRMSVREIGNFVAHRGERHKGPVTQIARDVFASVDMWSLPMRRRKPSRSATTTKSR